MSRNLKFCCSHVLEVQIGGQSGAFDHAKCPQIRFSPLLLSPQAACWSVRKSTRSPTFVGEVDEHASRRPQRVDNTHSNLTPSTAPHSLLFATFHHLLGGEHHALPHRRGPPEPICRWLPIARNDAMQAPFPPKKRGPLALAEKSSLPAFPPRNAEKMGTHTMAGQDAVDTRRRLCCSLATQARRSRRHHERAERKLGHGRSLSCNSRSAPHFLALTAIVRSLIRQKGDAEFASRAFHSRCPSLIGESSSCPPTKFLLFRPSAVQWRHLISKML